MTLCKWILVCGLTVGACAPSQLARQASRAAVDEGAEELTRQDTQESLQEAAADPNVQAATRDLTEQIAEGVVKALESDRAREQIISITQDVTQAAVAQLMDALGAEQTRAQLTNLTRGVTEAALQQAAVALQQDFRPAVRTMLQEEVAQGIAGGLRSAELSPALGQTARTVGYNLLRGANDGLGDSWSRDEGLLGEARGIPGLSRAWVWFALAGLGLLSLLFVSAAVMMVARAQKERAEVSRLESATLLLATAMRERQQTEQTDEILAVVQKALEGRAEKSGRHRIVDALRLRKAG